VPDSYTGVVEWLMSAGGVIIVALFLWLEVRRRRLKDYIREDSTRRP
jgi:hypothetical protein